MTDRAGRVSLKEIRVEVWRGEKLVRSKIMNFAKPNERQWFIGMQIWAWSNGYSVRSENTVLIDGQANSRSVVASSSEQQ